MSYRVASLATLSWLLVLVFGLLRGEPAPRCALAGMLLAVNLWHWWRGRSEDERRRERVAEAITWLDSGTLSLEQLRVIKALLRTGR